MQLTLDDLRKSSDPLAALLAMSDSDLDRVAAEVQGFALDDVDNPMHRLVYRRLGKDGWYEWFWQDSYHPAGSLGQAYQLDLCCREERGLYVRRIIASGQVAYILTPVTGPGETYDKDIAGAYEDQAGGHARAVTVLAILGLLQSGKEVGKCN